MLTLTHSPFLKALGWSLLNSLWQFGILWLLLVLFLQTRKETTAAIKHGFALVLMSAGFLWFAAGLSFNYFTYSETGGSTIDTNNFPGGSFYPVMYGNIKTYFESALPYLSVLYLLMVAGFFMRFTRFFYHAQHLQKRGLVKMKPALRLYVEKLVQQLGIHRKVSVWLSEHIDSPMVMGYLKPVILIPVACISQLSTQQLEAILLHELAHIRRNDYLVNLYIATVEILFFFNPFARLLVKSLKQEREKSCDDWVLQFRFDPYQYASALFSLEQSRSTNYQLALAATGEDKGFLLHRIQRIMGMSKATPESGFKLAAYFFTIALLSFIAFVTPGNLVVAKFERTYAELTSFTPEFARVFGRKPAISSTAPVAAPVEKYRKRTTKPVTVETTTVVEKEAVEENPGLLQVSTDINEIASTPQLAVLNSAINENHNFSIKEKDTELPELPTGNEYPFVPNSSYSFYNVEDSMLVKLRVEKEKIQNAGQSLAQAQRAIEQLDWNKIGKQQNLSKAAVIKLQKEIKKSIGNLNWSKLYKEVVDSINEVNAQNLKSTLQQEYQKLNNYKYMQQQYETIRLELEQQQDKYKNEAETELKEIEKVVRKKKVIVYL